MSMRPPEPEDDPPHRPSLSPELESLSPGSSLHSVSPVSFASNNSVETNNNESSKAQIMEKIIYVPTKKVGYLIGYQGRTIWGFEQTTGAKIDILEPNSRADETPVSLSGDKEGLRHVIRMIMDLYGCNNYSSQLWNDRATAERSPERKTEIIATEEIVVKPNIATLLIGTRGETIETIEIKSGVKVMIHQDLEDGSGAPITVTGTATQNAVAINLLKEKVAEFESLLTNIAAQANSVGVDFGVRSDPGVKRRKIWTVDSAKQMASRPAAFPSPRYPAVPERRFPTFTWSSSNSIELKSAPSSFLGTRFHPYAKPAGPAVAREDCNEGWKPAPAKSTKHKLRAFAFEVDLLDFARIAKVNDVNIDVLTPYDPNLKNIREVTVSGPESCVFNAKLDIFSGINAARKEQQNYH